MTQKTTAALLLDADNFSTKSRDQGASSPDPKRFVELAAEYGSLVGCYAFRDFSHYSVHAGETAETVNELRYSLYKCGFTNIDCPKLPNGGRGDHGWKDTTDDKMVEMASTLARHMTQLDYLIFATGDRNFLPVMNQVRLESGVKPILFLPLVVGGDRWFEDAAWEIVRVRPILEHMLEKIGETLLGPTTFSPAVVDSITRRWYDAKKVALVAVFDYVLDTIRCAHYDLRLDGKDRRNRKSVMDIVFTRVRRNPLVKTYHDIEQVIAFLITHSIIVPVDGDSERLKLAPSLPLVQFATNAKNVRAA
jgi:hypothetical protein